MCVCVRVCTQGHGQAGDRIGLRQWATGWVAAKGLRGQDDSPIHFRARFVPATHISMSILVGFDSGKTNC